MRHSLNTDTRPQEGILQKYPIAAYLRWSYRKSKCHIVDYFIRSYTCNLGEVSYRKLSQRVFTIEPYPMQAILKSYRQIPLSPTHMYTHKGGR